MSRLKRSLSSFSLIALALVVLMVGFIANLGTVRSAAPPLTVSDFTSIAEQGFGDRQNSWAWSMAWWKGSLYVGTNRAWHCAEAAALDVILKNQYPPTDPDIACTPDARDLPLQAEIWKGTPDSAGANWVWTRVYQSPAITIPGDANGKTVGLDVGYRGMAVYTDNNGQEALYVGGVSSRFMGYNTPPPRLLYSTDGATFQAVPQDTGTVMGNLVWNSLRNPVVHDGKFYLIAGTVKGSGELLESVGNPQAGNDNFRSVTPSNFQVSSAYSYNGFLYIGLRDTQNGYAIYKTDTTTGTLPYTWQPVVLNGGGLPADQGRNVEILNFAEFNGYLYAGGNGVSTGSLPASGNVPAELIRVDANDNFELVMGKARTGLDPLSGFTAGFGWEYNAHVWRQVVHDGVLYVSTFDSSTTYRISDPTIDPALMGFDLYSSTDGVHFTKITDNGFGDKFNFGGRTFASTPYGLALGTANYYYGLKVFLGKGAATPTPTATTATPVPNADGDLLADGYDIWTDPATLRTNTNNRIGLLVQRIDGKNTIQDVKVDFYNGAPSTNNKIGQGSVPFMSPSESGESTIAVSWPITATGTYTLYAVIDPGNVFPELNEGNNVVSRTVTVVDSSTDIVAPRVEAFTINNGDDSTEQANVTLATKAWDPSPGSGVASVSYIEFEYIASIEQWVPVNTPTWGPYTGSPTVNQWNLTKDTTLNLVKPGVKYLQAWVADKAGNISLTSGEDFICYVSKDAHDVGAGETVLFRTNVKAGDTFTATLTSLTGDADLFVWKSDPIPGDGNHSSLVAYSNLGAGSVDAVSVPISTTGVYQIEVYGATAASYVLSMSSKVIGPHVAATAGGIDAAKTPNAQPLLPVISGPSPSSGLLPLAPVVDFKYVNYVPMISR